MRKNTNMADMFRQVGALILKGAKPPDLPTAQGRHRVMLQKIREVRQRLQAWRYFTGIRDFEDAS